MKSNAEAFVWTVLCLTHLGSARRTNTIVSTVTPLNIGRNAAGRRNLDSRQKSDGRRQKVVCLVLSCVMANTPMESNGQVQCRQEQTSKSRSRSDFSRSPKPIDELSGHTTENDRDDNDADGGDYTE